MSETEPAAEIPGHILTFEEFTESSDSHVPRYNNLVLFFRGDPNRIETIYFQQLCERNPSLVLKIILFFQKQRSLASSERSLVPIEPDLYEAYKFMRGTGASDHDLFV